MTTPTSQPPARQPLRLWPGVVGAILVLLFWYALPVVVPDAALVGMMVGAVGVLAIIVWGLFFSRAPWSERFAAIVLMIAAVAAARPVVHESIRGGMMGNMLIFYAVPLLCLTLVGWAAATRRLTDRVRRASLVAAMLIACAPWMVLRTAGVINVGSEFHWRWTPTPEQRLLASASDEPKSPPQAPVETPVVPPAAQTTEPPAAPDPRRPAAGPEVGTATIEPVKHAVTEPPAEWPGFRGPERDGRIRGVRINTDWSAAPPVEMWRRPIGPGWSSFAVRGDVLYTQEQRGADEIVAAYHVSSGKPVWRHRDPVRFWESNGGAGPRATPTLSHGRVYAFGATGILNALDAGTGTVAWSRHVASDTGRDVPEWGFSSSPLVIDDVVIVAASGTLAAYDRTTGQLRWVGARQLGSYSSPHRVTIDGAAHVVLLSGSGAASFAPATGAVLWAHDWQAGGATIVQPGVTAEGDILINGSAMTGSSGLRRLAIAHTSNAWTVEERWTSTGLKPYFNDFVVHKGHAYGFDGAILSCIDLSDGTRTWKGGRYGNGQLVLLPEQDVLLVMSEEGELALVGATPDRFKELARVPALNAKTWNHPVVIRDVLLVRNGEEMAAFRLSQERR